MNWYHPKRLFYNIYYWYTHKDINGKHGNLFKFLKSSM